jgi:hypothetical protein
MTDTLQNPDSRPEAPRISSVTIMLGAIVLLAIFVSLWFLFAPPLNKNTTPGQIGATFKMIPAERDYLPKLRVEKIALSRAENFLHQEVTILNAEVTNDGAKTVRALLLTVEFRDELNQVVLRETRGTLGTPPVALAPGESRLIEISFDNVPKSWNRQQPSARVSYLQLGVEK